ncbi:transposase domain-containing protein [Ferrovum myxofaciens]|uniref:transposase domain-containing protein n=1 Tax=Ferrovum myxofaciens TaxID=416213 RepID=UPI003987C785
MEWFRRHLFGQKSERRNPDLYSLQLAFSDLGGEGNTPPPAPDTQSTDSMQINQEVIRRICSPKIPFFDSKPLDF